MAYSMNTNDLPDFNFDNWIDFSDYDAASGDSAQPQLNLEPNNFNTGFDQLLPTSIDGQYRLPDFQPYDAFLGATMGSIPSSECTGYSLPLQHSFTGLEYGQTPFSFDGLTSFNNITWNSGPSSALESFQSPGTSNSVSMTGSREACNSASRDEILAHAPQPMVSCFFFFTDALVGRTYVPEK